jgi:hypothetical protein
VNGEHIFLPSDGTSWAAAAVVGAAALIHQVTPAFSPAAILSILQDSGTPIHADGQYGGIYKRLNVDAALKLAVARAKAMRARRRARAAAATDAQATPQAVRANLFSTTTISDANENGATVDGRPVWDL